MRLLKCALWYRSQRCVSSWMMMYSRQGSGYLARWRLSQMRCAQMLQVPHFVFMFLMCHSAARLPTIDSARARSGGTARESSRRYHSFKRASRSAGLLSVSCALRLKISRLPSRRTMLQPRPNFTVSRSGSPQTKKRSPLRKRRALGRGFAAIFACFSSIHAVCLATKRASSSSVARFGALKRTVPAGGTTRR